MAETQTTGIKNAEELITLATAYGLTVTVEKKDRETLTSYVVRFAIPVPAAYAGTELGRAIAGDTLTLLWTKAHRKGARGRLEDATVWSATESRKVRTLAQVTAGVELLGRDAQKYARDAAPLPEDVVDAPHTLYWDGKLRAENIPAEQIRRFVKNRRFKGHNVHQDAEGAICIDGRRYVPVLAIQADANTYRMDVLDTEGAVFATTTTDRAGAQRIIEHPSRGTVAKSADGTITVHGAATNMGPRTHVLTPQPAPAEERQHVRIVNGSAPVLISSRDALAEINDAMMAPGKRAVREMSEGQGNARIVYRDPTRGTVELRAVRTATTLAVQDKRPTVRELTGPIDDALLASYAEMYAAIEDGTAVPVRADMVRPGMDVIAAVRLENRAIATVHHFNGPGARPWVSVTFENSSHRNEGGVYAPHHHLMVTVDSLERLYGPAEPAEHASSSRV
jgi:hypothetical protein